MTAFSATRRLLPMLALRIATSLTGQYALAATKPTFDCTKAASMAEKAICADPRLAKLDIRVSRSYKTALKHMDAIGRNALKDDQQHFIEKRNEDTEGDDVVTDKDRFKIVSKLLAERANFLDTIAPAPPGTIVGNWEGPSGYVRITRVDGNKLHIDLENYYPYHAHGTCGLDETVPMAAASLHIPDTGPDQKPTGAIINILRNGAVVTVDTSGDATEQSVNCGIGSAFQGTFFYIRPE
jgi:uncharacterized protein YecT (DUF1311 family)